MELYVLFMILVIGGSFARHDDVCVCVCVCGGVTPLILKLGQIREIKGSPPVRFTPEEVILFLFLLNTTLDVPQRASGC